MHTLSDTYTFVSPPEQMFIMLNIILVPVGYWHLFMWFYMYLQKFRGYILLHFYFHVQTFILFALYVHTYIYICFEAIHFLWGKHSPIEPKKSVASRTMKNIFPSSKGASIGDAESRIHCHYLCRLCWLILRSQLNLSTISIVVAGQ